MNTFEVLDASRDGDQARWLEVWSAWPHREVQAHPGYLALFASPGDRVRAALLQGGNGTILYPFLQRAIPAQPDACDLTSPYGYGGPYAWGGPLEALAPQLWPQFDAWARTEHVVCEFIRFAVGGVVLAPGPHLVRHRQDNIVVPTTLGDEERWRRYEHKVRKNVNKAKRLGITITVDEDGAQLDEFLRIYEATMHRRAARASYFFPRSFFERLAADLPGSFVYFHALQDGRVISTELALRSADRLYSFLGGTDEAAFDARPNDLLKHEMFGWAHTHGIAEVVLGGGVTAGDGIYRYKRDFFPEGSVPFATGERILDPARYAALVAQRGGEPPDPAFFPAYRAPLPG